MTPTTMTGSETWPARSAATRAAAAPVFNASTIGEAEEWAVEGAKEAAGVVCMAFTFI
jgi:hypothetical protein